MNGVRGRLGPGEAVKAGRESDRGGQVESLVAGGVRGPGQTETGDRCGPWTSDQGVQRQAIGQKGEATGKGRVGRLGRTGRGDRCMRERRPGGHQWGVGRGGVGVSGAAGVSEGEAALGRVEVSAKMGCGFIAAQVAWPGRSRRGPRRRRMAVLAACRT